MKKTTVFLILILIKVYSYFATKNSKILLLNTITTKKIKKIALHLTHHTIAYQMKACRSKFRRFSVYCGEC